MINNGRDVGYHALWTKAWHFTRFLRLLLRIKIANGLNDEIADCQYQKYKKT